MKSSSEKTKPPYSNPRQNGGLFGIMGVWELRKIGREEKAKEGGECESVLRDAGTKLKEKQASGRIDSGSNETHEISSRHTNEGQEH